MILQEGKKLRKTACMSAEQKDSANFICLSLYHQHNLQGDCIVNTFSLSVKINRNIFMSSSQ